MNEKFQTTWRLAVAMGMMLGIGGASVMCGPGTAFGSQSVAAPEFAAAGAWLNTEEPLSLARLRGRVVLLDFWTYCCINCMHIFGDLKYLEDKYHDKPFVVIGVHSGKFSEEKDAEHIRQAILRHNVNHPVVVDSDFTIWRSYGVQSWPTLVLIDPEGKIVAKMAGEGHRALLDASIEQLLKDHSRKKTLAAPMRFVSEHTRFETGVLEFPGKVLADAEEGRLFISDTNHHRVLVTDLRGNVEHVVGSGAIGLSDGPFGSARFHQPQGLALGADGLTLFVADTENHAIRAVDLKNKRVTTIAGTGAQSYDPRADGPGNSTPLSSPWDLYRAGSDLYVAMAGLHQIWVVDLASASHRVSVFAGTGYEAGIDGSHHRAAFAQPSGLAGDGKNLYVADSEISSIRVMELGTHGSTRTLAGSGGLFDFGATDGPARRARFQHPLGVALWRDQLFVADTFNHLIRNVNLRTGAVRTWLGTGQPQPGTLARIGFYEPGGLCVAGDTLYIADTNHHRIVAVDIATKTVKVLEINLPN